ncbi:putative methyltransferase [Podospora australis]|uniref:Methyltransferase n=1 Tax=Podospora australis TaxID=1536484 RepID=A0AAN7AL31_9PEZI|nr:putative methyltransferase [Podospora australis]
MSDLLNPPKDDGDRGLEPRPADDSKRRSWSKAPSPSPRQEVPEDEAIGTQGEHSDNNQPHRGQRDETIEPEDGPPDEDEFLAEGWDASSNGSTSVTSSIYAHTYENGRRYHAYRYGRYPIPNDDLEQNREDMKHAMMMEMTDGKLFLAPIGPNPQKIIDIGTGTGIWAIEMGDLFPSAEILGIDLSPIQPQWVPPNVKFMIDDAEDEWASGSNWDYAHLRGMSIVFRNLQKVIDQIYQNLKPGGYIEFQESHGRPQCDDSSMSSSDVMLQFYNLCVEALAKFGMDLNAPQTVGDLLTKAGFVNVTCVKRKIPVGVWPRDKTMRLIGLYVRETALQSLPSLTKAFEKGLGMSATEREVWAAKVKEAAMDSAVHRFYYFYFWWGQKPF